MAKYQKTKNKPAPKKQKHTGGGGLMISLASQKPNRIDVHSFLNGGHIRARARTGNIGHKGALHR